MSGAELTSASGANEQAIGEAAQMGQELLSAVSRIVDRAFCQRVLRECEADPSIEVRAVAIGAATSKGDNYTSDMFRARIEYSRGSGGPPESRSLIVKTQPLREGAQRDLVAKSSLFATEMSMMTDTLARMNELLGGPGLNGRGLYTQPREPPLLVIEDLAPLGFRMADRRAGLDMDHCLLAVRNLGRFHAASVALCEREPARRARYSRGMYSPGQPPEVRRFFVRAAGQLAAEAATWPELDPRIAPKIRRMAEGVYERGCQAYACREAEFNVINHGDFWVNNMLFKYNEAGRPVSHVFVDFQLCVYSSPGVDLNYFFNTSLRDDALRLHEDTLLHEYTRSLGATMASLGCRASAPSLAQVKAMLRERLVCGMLASFCILPLLLAGEAEVKDLNELLSADSEQPRNPVYSSPLYRRAMLNRLPNFDQMGLLD